MQEKSGLECNHMSGNGKKRQTKKTGFYVKNSCDMLIIEFPFVLSRQLRGASDFSSLFLNRHSPCFTSAFVHCFVHFLCILTLDIFVMQFLMKGTLSSSSNVSRSENTLQNEDLEKLLNQYFGYSGFRGKQLEAIKTVLSGKDCFCLMPTGGGKSMCYQVPALATPGIVLDWIEINLLLGEELRNKLDELSILEGQQGDQLVGTIIQTQPGFPQQPYMPCSLMETTTGGGMEMDGLDSTRVRVFLWRLSKDIHEDLNSGKPLVKLLYVTPELVATSGFMAKLIKAHNRGLLSLIAVDEAHCISTWGHDFRPSYRKLSTLRGHLPDVPILALTATAVPKVQKDVIESLQMRQPLVLRASFNRPNICYEVRYKDLLNDVYADLSNLLKSSGEICSIIYCLERSTCDELSSHLSRNGISSAAYHAGLNSKKRSAVLDDWLSSRMQVVVATVAFGYFSLCRLVAVGLPSSLLSGLLALDLRKDVRVVCHFNIPKSIEAFYQESGRAGRDQLPSRSVLYYGLEDRKRMEFILSSTINKKSQSSTLSDEILQKSLVDFKQMVDYCESSGCRRKLILKNFGEEVSASLCQKSCDACKSPFLISSCLAELSHVGTMSKKGGLAPVFIQRSSNTASYVPASEFWERNEEVMSDEEISNSEDEADAVKHIARSKVLTKTDIDAKFEALQQAEEIYYQNKWPKKQVKGGLCDRNIISVALREASRNRLLNTLHQAKERLGNHLLDVDSAALLLEQDCFKKYEKVGKTFYNSQIAATVRWLSSATYEQISNKIMAQSNSIDSEIKKDEIENSATPESFFPADKDVPIEKEKQNQDDISGKYFSESAMEDIPFRNLDLPRIPSFSEFVNRNTKIHQPRSHSLDLSSSGSGAAARKRLDAENLQRTGVDKKRRSK
ncbi:ATP-dependent DNA helicase Q-like 3 [Apostasia shenzhenica]|uniref:ATP-dependent DNA helicase n=1 Tax=Apostasia shenzhenica TaxID=1088818 RepID=A0A2I0A1Z1_9ASPA|nr:ATP-dependent DNA helicase Q-like 3 [Apostasia shenzhenica]